MILRYLVDGVENCPIGFMYNLQTGLLIAGSRKKSLELMLSLLVDYFEIVNVNVPELKEYGGHRVRIELQVSYRKWSRGIKKMLLQQIGIMQVDGFGRLLR